MAEHSPLITAADLDAYGVDTTDTGLVDRLLAAVSAGIREAAGAPISKVTSTVTRGGVASRFLDLPGGPVQSVDSVTLDGVPVTDFKVRDGMLWRRLGWGCIEDDLEVTWTHGWEPVPADVVKLAVNLVAAGVNENAGGLAANRGVVSRQESIDDYSKQESFTRGENELVDLTEIPERTRAWLRGRFSSQAYVTGSHY